MDLALALWQINPAAAYRLTDDKTAILEWRGPGSQPTPADLQAAWTAYQAVQQQAQQQASAATAEQAAATTDLRDQYAAALSALDQILAATSLTNAQLFAAVQAEARILRRVLRLLKDALAP